MCRVSLRTNESIGAFCCSYSLPQNIRIPRRRTARRYVQCPTPFYRMGTDLILKFLGVRRAAAFESDAIEHTVALTTAAQGTSHESLVGKEYSDRHVSLCVYPFSRSPGLPRAPRRQKTLKMRPPILPLLWLQTRWWWCRLESLRPKPVECRSPKKMWNPRKNWRRKRAARQQTRRRTPGMTAPLHVEAAGGKFSLGRKRSLCVIALLLIVKAVAAAGGGRRC